MRILSMVSLLMLLVVTPSFAQARDTTMVMVPRALLSTQQLGEVEQRAKIETYGKWVGLGKEVGEAVNSSLSAITDQTSKFAQTEVGKFTMFLILYKIAGNDIISLFFSIMVGFGGTFLLWWSYRKYVPTAAILSRVTLDDKGKEVKHYVPAYNGDMDIARVLHGVGMVIILISIALALFA